MADLETVKKWGSDNLVGILAFIAGLILIIITYKIIISILVFSVGAILVYFGLAKMKIKPITDFMDKMVYKIKSFLAK